MPLDVPASVAPASATERQQATRPRAQPSHKTRFTFGAGASYLRRYYGHEQNGLAGFMRVFESIAEGSIQLTLWRPAYFANVEFGGEFGRGHVVGRGYIGLTHLINSDAYTCTAADFACTPTAAVNLVYLGGSLGYAF